MLATLVQTGQGVERDPQRARALYRQACEGGYADACAKVGTVK
jgi:TPR repeat protein